MVSGRVQKTAWLSEKEKNNTVPNQFCIKMQWYEPKKKKKRRTWYENSGAMWMNSRAYTQVLWQAVAASPTGNDLMWMKNYIAEGLHEDGTRSLKLKAIWKMFLILLENECYAWKMVLDDDVDQIWNVHELGRRYRGCDCIYDNTSCAKCILFNNIRLALHRTSTAAYSHPHILSICILLVMNYYIRRAEHHEKHVYEAECSERKGIFLLNSRRHRQCAGESFIFNSRQIQFLPNELAMFGWAYWFIFKFQIDFQHPKSNRNIYNYRSSKLGLNAAPQNNEMLSIRATDRQR